MKKIKENAFTLVELLAVIVVLGILSSIAIVGIIKVRKDANKSAAQKIEKSLTDLGPGIYEYETTVGVVTNGDKKGNFLTEYNKNSSIYISIEELYNNCYLDDAVKVDETYKLKSPASGKYCDGYLEVTKTGNGPTFQGYINCEGLYKTGDFDDKSLKNANTTLTKSKYCKRSEATN